MCYCVILLISLQLHGVIYQLLYLLLCRAALFRTGCSAHAHSYAHVGSRTGGHTGVGRRQPQADAAGFTCCGSASTTGGNPAGALMERHHQSWIDHRQRRKALFTYASIHGPPASGSAARHARDSRSESNGTKPFFLGGYTVAQAKEETDGVCVHGQTNCFPGSQTDVPCLLVTKSESEIC
jgi:hypothetical protein